MSFLPMIWHLFAYHNNWLDNGLLNFLIGATLFWIISLFMTNSILKSFNKVEKLLIKVPPMKIISGSLGTIAGLIIAILISTLFYHMNSPFFNTIIPMILMISLGYLGFRIGILRLADWKNLMLARRTNRLTNSELVLKRRAGENFHQYKILDTNILIDGRIYDIVKTGIIEGTLLVPNFVLYELQYIADSADSIKRVRGRRGLDYLNKLQTEKIMPIEMYDGDYPEIEEVDSKIIQLAKDKDAVVITNDFNLNKVSQFQNVEVLNINELANALKPRVLAGETLKVHVVKNGKERSQGIGYLDDGTMIVVEDGKFSIGSIIEVVVTSTIQTDAGRMIFAKPLHATQELDHKKDF